MQRLTGARDRTSRTQPRDLAAAVPAWAASGAARRQQRPRYPPDEAFRIARRVPAATVELLRGPGHLMHEEEPQRVADLILQAAAGVKADARLQ